MRRIPLLFALIITFAIGCSKENGSTNEGSALKTRSPVPSAVMSPKEEVLSEIKTSLNNEEKFQLDNNEVELLHAEGVISDDEKNELLELTQK